MRKWMDKAKAGVALDADEALAVLDAPQAMLPTILDAATASRRRRFGHTASLCSILNAKSGLCAEDCAFCAQSARHATDVARYDLLSDGEILAAYEAACKLPVGHFGIVTSGKAVTDAELDRLCGLIASRRDGPVAFCASLGTLDENQLRRLKDAGLTRYHHNLETAESYFPTICTTHRYADRVATVRAARRVGLAVCSGGLLGLGETRRHRVELARALRELGVDSVPLNFLVPIPHTPAAGFARPLEPVEILKTIAMVRLVCCDAEVKVCAGRELHLREREKEIFAAGATGMMIGGYLTVRGRSVEEDLDLLARAGIKP